MTTTRAFRWALFILSMLPLTGCHAGHLVGLVVAAGAQSATARPRPSPPPEEVDVFAVEEEDEAEEHVSSVGLAVGVQNINSTPALTGTLDYCADVQAFRLGLYGVFAGGTTNMELRLGVRLSVVGRIDRWSLELGTELFGLARVRGVTGAGGGLGVRAGVEYRLSNRTSLAVATSIAAIEYHSVDLGRQSNFIGAASLGLRVFLGARQHPPL
ncbi:MAG: hypothetical protein ACI9KE_002854 [Polyangiales bacterium]